MGGSAALEYYDISPLVSPRTAVFPGDLPFKRKIALDFAQGANLQLSNIETTLHIGAHVDAPIHYHREGQSIEKRPLLPYYGACQVIEVNLPRGERIHSSHLKIPRIKAPRVLFKTRSFPDPETWSPDFNSLSSELVDFLARQGVQLVGIDTPSVDPGEDKELEAHQALYRHGMANLEGIVLEAVPAGIYTLIALPLRIEGADGSPVRAILVKES